MKSTWQGVGTELHSIPADITDDLPPLPGQEWTTQCGRSVRLVEDDFRRRVHRATCIACTRELQRQHAAETDHPVVVPITKSPK